jgi:hypothetical protein
MVPLSSAAEDALNRLVATPRLPVDELERVDRPGLYAWWGVLALPASVTTPVAELPLYVGKAASETLGERARLFHLGRTRGSALRRTLAAVLVHELGLAPHIMVDTRSWGLRPAGEERLTSWMRQHLTVTWVELDDPGDVEKELITHLLPPLNDKHAAGSPYRVEMRMLRQRMHSATH